MPARVKHQEEEGGEGYFGSVSDLMVGILFIFLLMLTVFALNFHDEQQIALEKYEELSKEAQRAKDEALAAEAQAAKQQDINQKLRTLLENAMDQFQREMMERQKARGDLLTSLQQSLRDRNIRKPMLIVAPTGLLHNWRAEHNKHLMAGGLGACTEAFGGGLKALKRETPDGLPGLDPQLLEKADWILTTYETLRDYITDFGAVRFAALLFDEAQKIKNPTVRLTDAAKSANADFIIAVTGTPVENRLADLWCITDTVHPAFLGDLKTFSQTYEDQPAAGKGRELRSRLDNWRGNRPPLMLRRMKRDKLPDLPLEQEYVEHAQMPAPQFAAYSSAIDEARGEQTPGSMLKTLHALRKISLHPDLAFEGSDTEFIAQSARLIKAFEALDRIADSSERALIFLEEREMQARLIGLIQRRYKLAQPPMLINGAVSGGRRQERVDRFQEGPDGFDAMVLSPKAGGVGLTLTRANHVIHLSRWWNPAVEDQCTGWALRIGQTRVVSIHIPIATLPDGRNSFDINLHALLNRKRQLSQEALLPMERPSEDTAELFRETVT